MGKKPVKKTPSIKVVCDTGPIVHLREAGSLSCIKNLGEINVPKIVKKEISTLVDFSWPKWIDVQEIPKNFEREAEILQTAGDIQAGETHSILLARSLAADWLLTDDLSARIFAKTLGIEVHGSLGIVLWNFGQGFIDRSEAKKILKKLSETSLWLSREILKEAYRAIDEID